MICFFPFSLFSQDSIILRNKLVKINTLAFAFQKISLQGEFIVNKKTSLLVGVSYTPEREIVWASKLLNPFFSDIRFTSFAFSPECRFYLSNNKNHGAGFYFAPYLRYKYSSLKTNFNYSDKSGLQLNIPLQYKINSFNLGAITGYQWILKNGFTIDWWIVGAHFGASVSSIGLDIPGINFLINSSEIKSEIDNTLNNSDLPLWVEPMIKSYLKQKDIGFSWTKPNFGLRSGLALGYAF